MSPVPRRVQRPFLVASRRHRFGLLFACSLLARARLLSDGKDALSIIGIAELSTRAILRGQAAAGDGRIIIIRRRGGKAGWPDGQDGRQGGIPAASDPYALPKPYITS